MEKKYKKLKRLVTCKKNGNSSKKIKSLVKSTVTEDEKL